MSAKALACRTFWLLCEKPDNCFAGAVSVTPARQRGAQAPESRGRGRVRPGRLGLHGIRQHLRDGRRSVLQAQFAARLAAPGESKGTARAAVGELQGHLLLCAGQEPGHGLERDAAVAGDEHVEEDRVLFGRRAHFTRQAPMGSVGLSASGSPEASGSGQLRPSLQNSRPGPRSSGSRPGAAAGSAPEPASALLDRERVAFHARLARRVQEPGLGYCAEVETTRSHTTKRSGWMCTNCRSASVHLAGA